MANCNRQQLNITCGTDVVLHDRLIFEGETFDPNLSVGIAANLVSSLGKRTALDVQVVDDELLISVPWIDGTLPGCYGLEVTGSCNSKKWATYADSLIKYTKATRIGVSEVTVESDSYDITQEVGYCYTDTPVSFAEVTVDDGYGTPSVDVEYEQRELRMDFHNLKGNGIANVEQTTTSTEDGGVNETTITMDNGGTTVMQVRNGRTGGTGPKGDAGDSAIFDPSTGNISTMKQTTGDDTLSPMSQKAVTDEIIGAKTYENMLVDDLQYQITNLYISHGTQKWRALSGVACVIVPVVEGGTYKLTATLYAAYLSDNTHASGGTPTFTGGTDSEFEWQANEERVLPQGVNFLYLMTKQQNEEITEHELYRIYTIKEQIDKNHSEFVDSIKQDTGDDTESIMSQKAVTDECKRIENYESEEIDESSYYLPQRYIQHSSQTWKNVSSQGCVLIPIKNTGKYTLKGANMYAAYLSDNSHTGTPSFAGGTTSEFTWQDGESKTIPNGVKYLYLLVRNENVDIVHELEYSCSIKEKINEIVSQGKKYEGLKMSILGDSMSTFGVPDQANATGTWTWPGNKCRYPQPDLFTDVRCQYWYLLMERLGLTFGINESIAGSRVTCNRVDDTDNLGPNRCISSLTRIGHLGENGDPDIIIIEAGGNDVGNGVAIGTFNTENPINYTEEQIAALPVATFADAYRAMLIRLQYYYRNSRMVVILPWFVNDYWTIAEADAYIEVIKEECDFFGIEYVDLRQCGITIYNLSNYLGDGIHPNAAGMELICEHLIRHYFN